MLAVGLRDRYATPLRRSCLQVRRWSRERCERRLCSCALWVSSMDRMVPLVLATLRLTMKEKPSALVTRTHSDSSVYYARQELGFTKMAVNTRTCIALASMVDEDFLLWRRWLFCAPKPPGGHFCGYRQTPMIYLYAACKFCHVRKLN